MPRDVSGTYTAPSNSFNPAVDGTDIDPADWNAILIDLVGQGLNVLPASLMTGGVVTNTGSSNDNAAARFDAATGKIIQNSPLIIADTTGALSRTGNGGIPVQGTNINDSAAAGVVGEIIDATLSSGSATSLTTATAKDIITVSLTAGDWDVSGIAYFQPTVTTSVNNFAASISSTLNTLDTTPGRWGQWGGAAQVDSLGVPKTMPAGPFRISLASTTTLRLVAQSSFTASTLTAYGYIRARRVR